MELLQQIIYEFMCMLSSVPSLQLCLMKPILPYLVSVTYSVTQMTFGKGIAFKVCIVLCIISHVTFV